MRLFTTRGLALPMVQGDPGDGRLVLPIGRRDGSSTAPGGTPGGWRFLSRCGRHATPHFPASWLVEVSGTSRSHLGRSGPGQGAAGGLEPPFSPWRSLGSKWGGRGGGSPAPHTEPSMAGFTLGLWWGKAPPIIAYTLPALNYALPKVHCIMFFHKINGSIIWN